MLIDVDNHAESHKLVRHIKKTHTTHVLYPIFKRNRLRMVSDMSRVLKVMLIDVANVNQVESHIRHILKKHICHMFYIQFSKRN